MDGVARTVAGWPLGAAPERWMLRVRHDVDAAAFDLSLLGPDVLTLGHPCVFSATSGEPAPLGTCTPPVTEGAPTRALAFTPVNGPGVYYLYFGCVIERIGRPHGPAIWPPPAPSAPPLSAPRAAGSAAIEDWEAYLDEPEALSAPQCIAAARDAAVWASLGARQHERSLGPPWPEPVHWGSHHESLGNARARLRVSRAQARHAAVRALIPWRRRAAPEKTRLELYAAGAPHEPLGLLFTLTDGHEAAEIIFAPSAGAGEYLLYYMAHATRWELV